MIDDLRTIHYIIILFALLFLVFTIYFLNKNNKVKKIEKENEKQNENLLEALGGSENIKEVSLSGSRVSLNLENKKSMDKEKVKENGVSAIVVTSKKITLVVGKKAKEVHEFILLSLKKKRP